ncbi:MAG: TrmH family RNA methyltransferase [Acidobacteriota bacterium]
MTLSFQADGVENPANLARIEGAARLLGGVCSSEVLGELIAVENARGARSIYGRKPLRGDATLALGNEKRGLSHRVLSEAAETVAIPTESRTVTTLNVAAAAAVAGWYVLHGSGPQARGGQTEKGRPVLLAIGDDHVEVGSTLRSAAAFGFQDVLLDDRGAGWFDGPSGARREAMAAARRHKNPIRVYEGALDVAARFEQVVFLLPSGHEGSAQRERLAHGRRQLIVIGGGAADLAAMDPERTRVASLGLEPVERPPLRLVASILLAEISRQVGRRLPPPRREVRVPPAYDMALLLEPGGRSIAVDQSELLAY